MSLAPGTRLGPYRVTAKIGAGGMGEVYRAHDSRTGRDVAIKLSAAEFSERFEREARAVAALNHANICTLYDVGPNYLVMELVEGTRHGARCRWRPRRLRTPDRRRPRRGPREPDGRWMAFATVAKGGHWLSRQRIGSSEPPQVLANMTGAGSVLAWSPDGASIAHASAAGVSIVAPEGGADRVLAPNLRPRTIAWSADARTLYGLVVDDEGSRIVVINVASGVVRVVRPLPAELEFTTPVTPGLRMTLNADGNRLLTTVLRARSDIWMMEGF